MGEFKKKRQKTIIKKNKSSKTNKPGFETLAAHLLYSAAPRNQLNCCVRDITQ